MNEKFETNKLFWSENKHDSEIPSLKPALHNGATFLCRGSGKLSLYRILYNTFVKSSRFTHTAICIYDSYDVDKRVFGLGAIKDFWILHAYKNQLDGTPVKGRGLFVISYSVFMKNYKGNIFVQKVKKPITKEQHKEMINFVNAELKRDPPFEKNHVQFMFPMIGKLGKEYTDLSSYFCTEIIAEIYIRMKLIDDSIASNTYGPWDFHEMKMVRTGKELKGGGKEKEINRLEEDFAYYNKYSKKSLFGK